MDPLSITVAILTILGSGGSVTSALKQITSRDAPDALLALCNEVSDLHLIVHEISHVLEEHQRSALAHSRTEGLLTNLGPVLARAKEKLLELESLIEYKLTTPSGPSGEVKLNRLVWVREQKKVQDIREETRSTRVNLAAMLGIMTSKATLRIECQLAELRFINDEFYDRQRAAQSTIRLGNSERALSDIIGGQTRLERNLNELLATSNTRRLLLAPISTARNTFGPERGYVGRWGLQILSARQRYNTVCLSGCMCCCHRRSTWESPRALRTLFGLLFIGYTGLPLLDSKCDNQDCLKKSGPAIYMKYYFPTWFMAHVLEVFAQISKPDGLTQSLRARQTVWSNAKIFRLCRGGDIEGLKLLLAQREYSPHVVNEVYYQTPLDQAVKTCKVEICKALLDAGADPHSEDINQKYSSPHHMAWTIILSKGASSATRGAFRTMFPNPSFDDYRFNSIHHAVLGLYSISLQEALRQCSSSIDAVDVDGRTALSWSSSRGDLRALECLLRNGADVNKADTLGNTPLSYAVRSGSRLCVQLLFEHGASLDTASRDGLSPLHRLAGKWDGLELLRFLVSNQVDINITREDGASPLICAISFGNHRVSKRLIELGANIHIKASGETNALSYAVERNSHSILELLLQRGADHSGEIQEYGSFLHLVADYADLESLRLLTNARLATRDIYHKRPDGLTALDVARKRSGRDLQLFNAFMKFVGSVNPVAFGAGLHNESDSEEEDFEDAVERQY